MIGTKKHSKLILPLTIIGSLLATLTQTVMMVAMPKIMADFSIDASIAQWLTNAYLLCLGIVIPFTGYLMKKYSSKILFISATALYTAGCLLSMAANVFHLIIISRMIQAMGAGILLPLVQVIIFRLYPINQRGKLMGVVGLVLCAGPGLGQILSGLLTDTYGWRSIFLALGIIALLSIIAATILLPHDENSECAKDSRLDVQSVVFSTFGFGGIVIAATDLGTYGVTSMLTAFPLAIGIVALVLFIKRQLSINNPLLELRVFKNRNFTTAVIYIAFVYGIIIASGTLSAVYIQTVRHFSATIFALVILPSTLILAVLNPITGIILDKRGPFILAIAGTFLLTCGSFLMSLLGANTSLLYFSISYSVQSVGIVGLLQPLATWSVNTLESKYTEHGTAIVNTVRQAFGAFISAMIIAIMSVTAHRGVTLDYLKGIDTAFLISAIIFFIAMILAVFLIPRRELKNQSDCKSHTVKANL